MQGEDFFEGRTNEENPESYGIWDLTGDTPLLVLQVDTDDPQFARGVQVGMIWQLLSSGVEEFEIPVYASNAEMVMRMTEVLNYSYKATYEEESPEGDESDWMVVSFKLLD